MNVQTLYNIALTVHIIGLTMMAGTTVVDFLVTQQFWRQFATDQPKAVAINEALSKFPVLFGIGIILIILSGVTMMGITRGAFGEQIWFRIKFCLVILIIVNALAIRRRQGSKLKKLLVQETLNGNSWKDLLKVRSTINWFHLSQLTFFVTVFVLSVFKFN